MIQAVIDRCAKKGRDDLVLFENSEEHMYSLALTTITVLLHDSIEYVHFDGDYLHIFMKPKFKPDDRAKLMKIFKSTNYTPTSVLFDLLRTKQAVFLTREVYANGILETCFDPIEPHIGPFDHTDVELYMFFKGIVNASQFETLIFKVGDAEETFHDGLTEDQLNMPMVGSKGESTYNSMQMVERMIRDRILLSSVLTKISKGFKQSNKRR